jgi:hypothetical protein
MKCGALFREFAQSAKSIWPSTICVSASVQAKLENWSKNVCTRARASATCCSPIHHHFYGTHSR